MVPAILFAILNTGHAADEDLNASVYLTFDPETGEFITQQESPSGDPVPTDHAQSQSQPAPGAEQPNSPAQTAAASPAAQSDGAGEAGGGTTGIWLGGLVALGLLAGIGLWVRKGQQKVPT